MRQQFEKDIRSLDAVFGFLRKFADNEGIDGQSSYVLDLAVEEFFTNIVKYGRGTGREILLDAVRSGKTVTVRLEEETSVPFDVTRPTKPSSTCRSRTGNLGGWEYISRGRCFTAYPTTMSTGRAESH